MYDDDDIDDDDLVEIDETAGPASGGYDAYIDGGDEETFDDENDTTEQEEERREEAERARGKEERAFYDGLAKAEDAKHDAMRKDYQKRSLVAGEMRQKLRHEQMAIDAIALRIAQEQERIDTELQKKYRKEAQVHDGEVVAPITPPQDDGGEESKDEGASLEFSIDLATNHIKQLEDEKASLEREHKKKLDELHEEERALSQIQYKLSRM